MLIELFLIIKRLYFTKIPWFSILSPAFPGLCTCAGGDGPRVTGQWPGPALAPVWPRHQEGVHTVITESQWVITQGQLIQLYTGDRGLQTDYYGAYHTFTGVRGASGC